MGGLPLVGDPDVVARDMAQLAALGLKGIAVSFVNYLDELPFFCAEVLPRLARSGLRDNRAPGRHRHHDRPGTHRGPQMPRINEVPRDPTLPTKGPGDVEGEGGS